MPNMAYFVFLPHEGHDSSSPSTLSSGSPAALLVDLADVEVGKEYELVITTLARLCRYRVGDVRQVAGFHNSAPHFHFMRRKDVLLSINSGKTDETELQKAVANTSKLLREFNTRIVEYTSYAEMKTILRHYVIYWELNVKEVPKWPSGEVLNRCCLAMEESLNSVYQQGLVIDNSVGPLETRVMKNETFEKLMEYAISRGRRSTNTRLRGALTSRRSWSFWTPELYLRILALLCRFGFWKDEVDDPLQLRT